MRSHPARARVDASPRREAADERAHMLHAPAYLRLRRWRRR